VTDPKTRRFFLGAVSAAAASRVWGANDKINVGIVGLGGRGTNHLNLYSRMAGARVAGLCDVNQAAREVSQATLVKNTGEKAKEFEDMRAMFADATVEAVSIATPNHWHALATIWALKAGKDVYCEKPACYNVYEGLRMLQVQRETGKLVQVGSQHRSMPFKMKAIAALQQGLIGKIYQAKGLCYKRRLSIGHKADSPIPAGVNWDLFLGPAPMRPFNELRFKYNWHWFWDTGNGDIGNQGVHELGIARWALGDPEWPASVYSSGGKFAYVDDQETPNTQLANFDYGGRQIVFEVRGLLTGGEGVPARRPAPAGSPAPAPPAANPMNVQLGNLFYGTEGWAAMTDSGFQAYKGESSELIMEERPERRGDPTDAHMLNFLSACRSRNEKELHDPISKDHVSAGLCHLANISYRVGRKLTLEDGPKFTGDAEATRMLTRDVYRKPYEV
jgi:predicted dehydrogenase